MKEKNYSRADLWAFAAMLGFQHGVKQNNLACDGEWKNGCGHFRALKFMDDCKIDIETKLAFKFGRKDCVPENKPGNHDDNWGRDFLTTRPELHPETHGNGPTTVDFFKEQFGLEAKYAIVLLGGAHSMGKLNKRNSGFDKYPWTNDQEGLFNNQMLRNYAQRPQYSFHCSGMNKTLGKRQPIWVGNATGHPAETGYMLIKKAMIKDKDGKNNGPYLFQKLTYSCNLNCTETRGGYHKDYHTTKKYKKCCTNLGDGLLLGASTVAQLEENLAACQCPEKLPEPVLAAFNGAWAICKEEDAFPYWRSYSMDQPDRENLHPGASYQAAKK